jgi:hypothetical protein
MRGIEQADLLSMFALDLLIGSIGLNGTFFKSFKADCRHMWVMETVAKSEIVSNLVNGF